MWFWWSYLLELVALIEWDGVQRSLQCDLGERIRCFCLMESSQQKNTANSTSPIFWVNVHRPNHSSFLVQRAESNDLILVFVHQHYHAPWYCTWRRQSNPYLHMRRSNFIYLGLYLCNPDIKLLLWIISFSSFSKRISFPLALHEPCNLFEQRACADRTFVCDVPPKQTEAQLVVRSSLPNYKRRNGPAFA